MTKRKVSYADYIGKKINRLIILDHFCDKRSHFVCKCECGAIKTIIAYNVISAHTVSCGCYHKEYNKAPDRPRHTVHGLAGKDRTPEYSIWKEMRGRCNRPSHHDYKWYGARGIKICNRWDNYVNFIQDMGIRPSLDHSIDRINNDGDYEPGNCRWATREQQVANKRKWGEAFNTD